MWSIDPGVLVLPSLGLAGWLAWSFYRHLAGSGSRIRGAGAVAAAVALFVTAVPVCAVGIVMLLGSVMAFWPWR